MSWELIVRPKAEEELLASFRWYEERREGLGIEFLQEIERAFERIMELPLAPPIVYRETRRVLVRRFPYAVFYVVTESHIRVIAVTHQSQDPESWRSRA